MEGDRKSKHQLGRTLVLGADYRPVSICDSKEAICDVLDGKVEMVESKGIICHSQYLSIEVPSVVRYLRGHTAPYKKRSIPLTTRSVLARDGHECAYGYTDPRTGKTCLGRATTMDHIIPRAKGGEHSWLNVVAACRRCNGRKGHHTLEELGWTLKFEPYRPEGPHARLLLRAEPGWAKYFRK